MSPTFLIMSLIGEFLFYWSYKHHILLYTAGSNTLPEKTFRFEKHTYKLSIFRKVYLQGFGVTEYIKRHTCISLQAMRDLAMKCMCELLVEHPHFNFRTNIIAVIGPFTNHKNQQVKYSPNMFHIVEPLHHQQKDVQLRLKIIH